MQPTSEDCAYAAGFLDGEGCISIFLAKSNSVRYDRRLDAVYGRGDKRVFRLAVTVAQSHPTALHWLAARWGGQVNERHPRRAEAGGWKPSWTWYIGTKGAAFFLQAMQPYAIVKADQIVAALAFRATYGPESFTHLKAVKPTGKHFQPGNQPGLRVLKPEVLARRLCLMNEIKRLNARGRTPRKV